MKSSSPGISTWSNSHGYFVGSSCNMMEGSKNKQRERGEREMEGNPAHLQIGCPCREPCRWFCVVLLFPIQVIHLSISKSTLGDALWNHHYQSHLLFAIQHHSPHIKMHLELHFSIKNQVLDFEMQTRIPVRNLWEWRQLAYPWFGNPSVCRDSAAEAPYLTDWPGEPGTVTRELTQDICNTALFCFLVVTMPNFFFWERKLGWLKNWIFCSFFKNNITKLRQVCLSFIK